MNKVFALRFVHGLFALYFLLCLIYLYYAALFSKVDFFLLVAVISLGIEGFMVFILNNGDCPLIHLQRRVGDNTPFFNLFFPTNIAKRMVPILAKLAWMGMGLVVLRIIHNLNLANTR